MFTYYWSLSHIAELRLIVLNTFRNKHNFIATMLLLATVTVNMSIANFYFVMGMLNTTLS